MIKRKTFYKIISGVLLAVFCLQVPAGGLGIKAFGATSSYQGQIDQAKKNKEKLEKEKKALEKKLAALKVEKNNLEKAIKQLDDEYMELFDQIEATEEQIEEAEFDLVDIETELIRMEGVAADQYEAMKMRVKYLYENGEESLLALFLGGVSIERIFNELEYRSQITKYDKLLLARYNDTIAEIKVAKELQIARVEELEAMKEYQKAELDGLELLANEKKLQMAAMAEKLGIEQEELLAYTDSISQTQSQIKELEVLEKKRLEEEERKRKEAESRDIKNMIWPLETSKTITSRFGARSAPTAGASTYHKGIDIGAPTGTAVHAVLAGTVEYAGYNSSSGNYIIIDHGNGLRTTYAHASKLLVKTGDTVKRDQIIMKVGSTGVSTGPHLHFGVFINGVAVDPLKYVKYNR